MPSTLNLGFVPLWRGGLGGRTECAWFVTERKAKGMGFGVLGLGLKALVFGYDLWLVPKQELIRPLCLAYVT